jgi:hypothetical protein
MVEILRGLRHNYVAEALRMTFYSLFVNCCQKREIRHKTGKSAIIDGSDRPGKALSYAAIGVVARVVF